MDSLSVATGVIVSEVGELEHISADCVGPHAKGVLLLGHEDAQPSPKITKPLSSSALGLLVPGQAEVEDAHLQGTSLRFAAKLAATGEPVLLFAFLHQLGAIDVRKYQPQQTSIVEVTPSVVVKICVFRDELPQEWPEFVRAPIKSLLEHVPQLRTCKQVGCGCCQWHGSTGPGEPQALLDIWGRTAVKSSVKPEAPQAAAVFIALLRLPAGLLRTALATSGTAGIFCEPRDPTHRATSPDSHVVWLPKSHPG